MPSEFDLLVAELAEVIAAKDARQMAKALPAAAPRAKPPTYVTEFVPPPLSPLQQAQERRREMLAVADRVEVLAKAHRDAGRITGVERSLIGIQIAQLRRDAEGAR